MPTITSVDLAPSSPVSDVDSLVFDSSSEGVHTPYDQRFPAGPAFDGAKVVASVGVTVHSPPARFVGTPFATGNGPGSPFEYPFPATRPAISNTSSVSSVTSSLLGPPSPTTRARFIPRISTQQVSKRRGSGGTPQVRVPPRLRTDSGGSACSNTSQAGEASGSTNNPKSSRALPPSRSILTHSRLRDRSGSLGVLPMILPPSTIATVGTGHSAGPVSSVPVVEVMASAGLEATATPGSEGEGDESETDMSGVPSWQRRASLPAAFAPRPSGDSDSDSGPDKEASDDHTGPSTPQGTDTR